MTDGYVGVGESEPPVEWQTFDVPYDGGTDTSKADLETITGGENRGPPFYFTHNEGVYVLQLRGGKFYVGASRELDERMCEHFAGDGSLWTARHPPVAVHRVYPACQMPNNGQTLLDFERERTVDFMARHGVENVRGGPWAHPDLSETPPLPSRVSDDDTDIEHLQSIYCDVV